MNGTLLAQQTTTGDDVIRLRLGPGYGFAGILALSPHSPLTLLGTSPDLAWTQVEYLNMIGWAESSRLPTVPNLPVIADIPAEPPLASENCISLVGDSVAHGDVVYMVPGNGFGVVRTTPLAQVLQAQLTKNGLGYLEVRDHTASAAFLSDLGKFPYRQMPEYAALMADRCRFILIMPWINDLSVERENGAAEHIADMTSLLSELFEINSATHIMVLGFYSGQRADFVENYAPGYTAENVAMFNTALKEACFLGGAWDAFLTHLSCFDTEALFAGMDFQHVVRENNREEVEASLYEPIPADVLPFFQSYWINDPSLKVVGDGVHLSGVGKEILAEAIIARLLWIDPRV